MYKTKQILKRCICLIIVAFMLISMVSCSGTKDSDTKEVTTSSKTSYIDTLESRDFGGTEFVIMGQNSASRQNFYNEGISGEITNDAMYERDVLTESRLNIELVYDSREKGEEVMQTLLNATSAGDKVADVVICPPSVYMAGLLTQGALADISDFPHLTLESERWNKSVYNDLDLNGHRYYTCGPIARMYMYTPIVFVFNQRLISEHKLENPYELVKSGKWTVEKLYNMTKNISADVNNDGKMDYEDFYGAIFDASVGNALYTAAGLNSIIESNGKYILNLDSDSSVDFIQKCGSYLGNRNLYLNDLYGNMSYGSTMFKPGKVVFMNYSMLGVSKCRDMDDDYGIIPVPKYTEEQTEYLSSCNTFLASAVGVPITCENADDTGLVMETMAHYSHERVYPAVYENVLQHRVARDPVAYEMLDVIYENASYDMLTCYLYELSTLLRNSVCGDETSFASMYKRIKRASQAKLDELVTAGLDASTGS